MTHGSKEDTVEESSLRECPFCGAVPEKTFDQVAAYRHPRNGCFLAGKGMVTGEPRFNYRSVDEWNTRPQSTVTEEMIEALQVCANKFWEYVIIHEGKKTPDGQEKADRNREMAEMCDAALSKVSPLVGAKE